jgi:hypothetical protein
MFEQMVSQMTNTTTNLYISRKDYELFCKEYVFDKLKGISFGNAFCKRFDIRNYAISNMKDEAFTEQHIEKWYIENETKIH